MAEPATIASVQADYVDVDGARIHVHRWGDGGRANIVYWHGGGGGRAELPLIAPALEKAGYSVFAPDAPGYGESPPLEDAGYRASNVARLATALIDTLGIAPTVWIGYSWGASIGIHSAARAPDRFKALVLLDGGYFVPEDDPDYDPSLDLAGHVEAWRAEIDEQDGEWDAPAQVMAAAMAGSNEEPALSMLPAVEVTGLPVLLLHSTLPAEYDDVRAGALARFRKALPSAEVVPVASGHGILTDAGDDVRRIVLAWLSRCA
jgi:pimeloyl-ACP methyl ester carboxylesterase